MQAKYTPIAIAINKSFHDKDRCNFPFKRTSKSCSQKVRNLEKTYKSEHAKGRRHKLHLQTTGAATQEDADVGEEYGTRWQLFDAVYMALYHENPCDPDFQQAS